MLFCSIYKKLQEKAIFIISRSKKCLLAPILSIWRLKKSYLLGFQMKWNWKLENLILILHTQSKYSMILPQQNELIEPRHCGKVLRAPIRWTGEAFKFISNYQERDPLSIMKRPRTMMKRNRKRIWRTKLIQCIWIKPRILYQHLKGLNLLAVSGFTKGKECWWEGGNL